MNYKNYYISIQEDCDENKGGYYCEIWNEDEENFNDGAEIDYFCIHVEELKQNSNIEYWVKKYINENFKN